MKTLTRILSVIITILTAISFPGLASGASIGVNFLTGGNVDGTNGNALAATDFAGASTYAQMNWNNLASSALPITGTASPGVGGTNVVLVDDSGAATSVAISWAGPNTWSQTANSTANLGIPDYNLMNPYLDNNGNANVSLGSGTFDMFAGTNDVVTTPNQANRNWPLVYLTGLQAWMTAQAVTAYDVVIYFDGDNAAGRTGEYWAVNASGDPGALTVGVDASTHVFGCDLNNFANGGTPTFSEVLSSIQTGALPNVSGGLIAEYGNFPGNYTVIKSLTNDTVLLRTQRYNSRAPINAIQIIPRATVLPVTVYSLFDAPVYLGATARFAPTVAGGTPMTFQWQKNGANLTDGGNISGATTSTLRISNVSAADVSSSYALVVTNPLGVITSAPAALTLVAPVGNSYPEKIYTNSPYAYWRFNETADLSTGFAPAYDYVGGYTATYGIAAQNGSFGVVGPAPTEWPGFESGNAAYQSSRSARQTYLMAPPLNLNTNTVTMCAWIYPTAAQGGATALLASRNGSDVGAFGYGNNNNLGYTWNNNSSATYNFVSGLVPLTNAWSFVALTVSPSNAILYLYNTNGQFSATNAIAHTNQGFTGITFLGSDAQGAGIATPQNRGFVGTIDELSVFNRTLPPAEIYNLYKKGLGLNAIGPVVSTQPKPLALFEGRNAKFAITASGDLPLTYQWRKNGSPLSDGGNISGATTPSLTISNVSIANDAGNYDIVVGNLVGNVPSSAASLIVVSSNSAPTAYEAQLRQQNPIAYWRLNEINGSAASFDYWGGNIATNENVFLGVTGPLPPDFAGLDSTNTAGQYDGFSAATVTSESLMNNRAQFSIIGWFNTAGPIGTRVGLFGQNDVCEFGFHGAGPDGLAQLGIWTPRGAAFLNQTNIMANVWYMVAAIGDGTNVSLTLVSTNGGGGFQVLQAITPHAATTNYGSSAYFFNIGGGGVMDATGNFFTGLIDEVAVYDRALSNGELSDLFGAALTGGVLPPGISGVSGSVTLYAGRTATFHVNAVGTALQYQWRSNGVPLTDGGNLFGALSATLTITNVSAANVADYDVIVSNSADSVTSAPPATLTVITPTPGSYEAAVIAANPIAYYRLNSTNDPSSGTEVNLDLWGGYNGVYGAGSQNGFSGILGPQPPVFKFETNNPALGTIAATLNSYATAPFGSLSTNNASFTMWIQPTGTFDDYSGLLVNRGAGVAGGFGFGAGGQLGYTWNNNNANTYSFPSGLVPPLGQWTFVALVVEPTQATIYMSGPSGLLSATNIVAHTPDVFGNNWQIGHDNNGGNATRTFNGLIDEVAVFNYSLTPSQMLSLYYAGTQTPTTLTISRSGTDIILTWPQGTLLQADDLSGPWTTNNATSPFTTAPSGDKKFYRVIVQ